MKSCIDSLSLVLFSRNWSWCFHVQLSSCWRERVGSWQLFSVFCSCSLLPPTVHLRRFIFPSSSVADAPIAAQHSDWWRLAGVQIEQGTIWWERLDPRPLCNRDQSDIGRRVEGRTCETVRKDASSILGHCNKISHNCFTACALVWHILSMTPRTYAVRL